MKSRPLSWTAIALCVLLCNAKDWRSFNPKRLTVNPTTRMFSKEPTNPISDEPALDQTDILVLRDESAERTESGSDDFDAECQTNLIEYVYREDLCGQPDVESFVQLAKTLYTCAGRCGREPGRSRGGLDECHCDTACLLHNDCCRDIHTACPQLTAQAEDLLSQFEGAQADCIGMSTPFLVITHAHTTNTVTEMSPSPPSQNPENMEEVSLSVDGAVNILADYQHGLLELFKVADVEVGVLFANYLAFASWRLPLSRLRFVPHVVSLENCMLEDSPSSGLFNVVHLLSLCSKFGSTDVLTPFHRSCRPQTTVSCETLA